MGPPRVVLATHPSPHPFVRRPLVASAPRGLATGEVVTLVTREGEVVGDGLWNPRSDIAVRRLTEGDVRFDAAWLQAALDRAVDLRRGLPGLDEEGGAFRVVHSEGDGLSGLIVDKLDDVLVLELHSAGWPSRVAPVLAHLHGRLGTAHHRLLLGERVARLEGVATLDASSEGCPRRVVVREHGVRHRVDLSARHKTGFFCDQRDNRRRFAGWARGDVLDVCCHGAGFSLAAAAAGAGTAFTAIDLDEGAVAHARDNINLNRGEGGGPPIELVRADAFDWMRQVEAAGRRFDTIVLDPPKFVPTRRDQEKGELKYRDLNRLALRLLRPGGRLLTCCCSGLVDREAFTGLVRAAARKEGRAAAALGVTGAAPDHPVLLECPETEYLKALWLTVW